MKKSILILLIVIAWSVSLTSCGKKNESDEPNAGGFLIKGTIDGKELVCNTGISNFSSDLTSAHAVGRIKSGNTFTGIDLFFLPFTGKGTYLLGGESRHIGQYYVTADGNADNSYSTTGTGIGNGKIIVDSYTDNIATGTFEFTAGNSNGGSKKITKGSFSFKLTRP